MGNNNINIVKLGLIEIIVTTLFLEGGCSVPVAVTTKVLDNSVMLEGGVWSIDGKEKLKSSKTVSFSDGADIEGEGEPLAKKCKSNVNFAAVFAEIYSHRELTAAEQCGRTLATELISRGAEKILAEAKAANAANDASSK